MTEEQLKENAGLYSLGLLDERELGRFERALDELPQLRAYVAEMEDAVAGVTLTAPTAEVSPVVLDRIMDRIACGPHDGSRAQKWVSAMLKFPGGWAAAAALAVLLGIGFVRYERIHSALSRAEGERDAVVREMRNMVSILDGDGDGDGDGSGPGGVGESPDATGGATAGSASKLVQAAQRRSYRLLQNFERVNSELAAVRDREAERAVPNPGIARPLVVSMWDPNVPVEERENAQMLSETVSDIIGDQLEVAGEEGGDKETDSDEPDSKSGKAVPPAMSFDSWPEVEVTGDSLAPLWFTRDLPNGPQIRHKNFPVDRWNELGLTSYENGSFYDSDSNLLYTPSINGSDYLGARPPQGFDPTSGIIPPQVEIASAPDPVQPGVAPSVPLPKAFTLYDESTGEGSIILQNLPPRLDDQAYHLWLNDSPGQIPIEVGILPDLEGGDGRVFFELQPGLSPSGYILTSELRGAAPDAPIGDVILFGP